MRARTQRFALGLLVLALLSLLSPLGTVQAQGPTSTELFRKVYNMRRNYGNYSVYRQNMLMTLWGVSPGSKFLDAYKTVPDNFEGQVEIAVGTTWLNGVFGPYTYKYGMGDSEVGGVKQGGGACDILSFVAETLDNAVLTDNSGIDKLKVDSYSPHPTTIPGVDPKYSLAVSTSRNVEDKNTQNGADVRVVNKLTSPVTLHWKVEGDSLTLWVTTGTPLPLPVPLIPAVVPAESQTWIDQHPELVPIVAPMVNTWDQFIRWLYGNGEDVKIIVAKKPVITTPALSIPGWMIWVIAGVILLAFALILWLKPGEVGKTMLWVSNNAPRIVNTWKLAARGAFQWWLFLVTLSVVMTPALRAIAVYGFTNWLDGQTTFSNKMLFVLILAFGMNKLLQKWFMAKTIRDQNGYIREVPAKRTGCLWGFVKFNLSVSLVILMFFTVTGLNLAQAISPTPLTPNPTLPLVTLGDGSCNGQLLSKILTGSAYANAIPPAERQATLNAAITRITPELESVYAEAERQTGVPCEVLAGIHFVEANNRPGGSLISGRAIGTPEPDQGGKVYSSLLETAIDAAKILKGKVSMPRDTYAEFESVEQLITALSRYNGGGNANCKSSYPYPILYAGCPRAFVGEDDPYAINWLDARHATMYLLYCRDYTACVPQTFQRPGSFTIALWFYRGTNAR